MSSALVLTACAPSVLLPTATPTPAPEQFPAQPAFSASAADLPPEDVATATSTPATLTSSLSAAGTDFDTSGLLNTSQGGYTTMQNLNWFTDQAAQMSSMGIKEIRIDHIFDDPFYKVVSLDAAGAVAYDFSRLDQVMLPLLKQGITPFVSLSYSPKAIAANAYTPPASLDVWSQLVVAFVTHYRDLGYTGFEYEVWNELDTSHWRGTQDQYNALYTASAHAVRSVDSTARIGGPAASAIDSAGNWSVNFINYLSANPTVPIDFFTTHSYRTGNWEPIEQARTLLTAAGLGNLPIYITEWNNDSFMDRGAGQGSDTNSSIDGSSYLARRLYLASQSDAEKFYYFSPVEGLNPHLPYNGDIGLVTADGHRKAGGNVFEMYSKLGPTLQPSTVEGAGTATTDVYGLVTTDAAKTTSSTLMWNHTANDVEMTVNLTDLPYAETNFTSTVSMVSAARGNGFSDTSTLVAPSYPSANENAPIVADSVLGASTTMTTTVTIPAYGVANVVLAPTTEEVVGQIPTSAEPAATNIAAAALGSVAIPSSSVEKPAEGWSTASLNDGRRYSIEPSTVNIKGWSSAVHETPEAVEAVGIDLTAVRPVDTVVLWPRDSQVSDGKGFPAAFTIQGSVDNVTWTTIYTATAYNDGLPVEGPQTFSFPAAEYQFLKIEATTLTSTSATAEPEFSFQLAEVEAFRTGIVNGGFETGNLDGWERSGKATVQSDVVRGGTKALQLTGADASVTTQLEGLLPNTTYTFGAHIRPDVEAVGATLSVSDFGGETETATAEFAQWQVEWITFTTGPESTSAELSLNSGTGTGKVWADDFLITQKVAG